MTARRLPERAPGPPEALSAVLFKRDRVAWDVKKELEHLERNLALDDRQRRGALARLKGLNALLRLHAAGRLAHRRRMRAMQKKVEGLNRLFRRRLAVMDAKERAARRSIRAVLNPAQRKHYDLLLAERERLEREWVSQVDAADRARAQGRGEGSTTG